VSARRERLQVGDWVMYDGDAVQVATLNDVAASLTTPYGVTVVTTREEAQALPKADPPHPTGRPDPTPGDGPGPKVPPAATAERMRDSRMRLEVGTRMLTERGYAVVTALAAHTARFRYSDGSEAEIPLGEIAGQQINGDTIQAHVPALEPWWSSLPESAKAEALLWQEVVNEIETGYRYGHERLALPGEPFFPFGSDATDRVKCERMAELLTYEKQSDRKVARRISHGEIQSNSVSLRTVQYKLADSRKLGLRGLVSGNASRGTKGFNELDPRVRAIADGVFAEFDGDVSKVNIDTIDMRVRLEMKTRGIQDVHLPQRLWRQYLSHRSAELGANTRAHRSGKLRKRASGTSSFAAASPADLALDATRVDNLVWDPIARKARSVEVLTLISVSTRVVVGLCVTPRSATALEAGLVLWDAMRPLSMVVEGTTVHDWRWCGLPESIDFSNVAIHRSPNRIIPPGGSLQGEHLKPSVLPSSIRNDHGSIFTSDHFMALLDHFGIEVKLSQGKNPISNAHVERIHETYQRAYQQIPGYKGHNVSERGRRVEHRGDALLTAEELERHLRRFIALDYHQEWHQGLVLPGAPEARLTPLEMWDAITAVTGRIDVPQSPDSIFQFLPQVWLTIGHAGVERKNMGYDAPVLDEFRHVAVGTFKPGTRKAPFFMDPRDVSRLWFSHPETGKVHEIPWRAKHLLDLPLTDVILDRALDSIQARGGNNVLKRGGAATKILEELGQLTSPEELARNRAYAERLRYERSQRDFAEVVEFASRAPHLAALPPSPDVDPETPVDDYAAWPDYDEAS
jgi:putative transposase